MTSKNTRTQKLILKNQHLDWTVALKLQCMDRLKEITQMMEISKPMISLTLKRISPCTGGCTARTAKGKLFPATLHFNSA